MSTPSLRHFYGLDVAVFVELHAVDADDAVVRPLARDWTAVVADAPVILTHADDRMVSGAGRERTLHAQHLALELERPERRVADAVVDAVVVPRPSATRVHEVPLPLPLEHH